MRFLSDRELGPAIKKIMAGRQRRCAVAFWGNGATQALFGAEGVRADDRIVCDVSMGGTNPAELVLLGAPGSKRLKHVPGLHAKVYLSTAGMVVGSANASENGVGFTAPAGLVEAGVEVEPGEISLAIAWFQQLWNDAESIDPETLAKAAVAWKRRAGAGRSAGTTFSTNPTSLLHAVRADPERFRDVGFVLTRGVWSEPDAERNRKAVRSENDLEQREDHEVQAWSRHDMFGATPGEQENFRERFICIHEGRTLNRYWPYRRRFSSRSREVVLASRDKDLKKEKGFKAPLDTLARTDLTSTKALFKALGSGGRRIFVNGEELARALDALGV